MTSGPHGSQRLVARDRTWLAVDSLRTCGPLHGVTVSGLRDALVRLHEEQPALRCVSRLDRAAVRWVPLSSADFAGFVESLVVPVDTRGPDRPDAVTRWLIDEPLGERPLLLAVADGYVGAKISHALGDGRIVNTLFPELIRAAVGRRPARPPFPAPVRLPLVRAAMHTFGRHPGRLVRGARITRPPVSEDAGPWLPWKPDVMYRSVRSPAALADVRAWRDRYAPGLSAAAVLFAATPVALARCGLAPKWPGAVVLVDARRYLPVGATVDGNFSWGQYVVPTDLGDPRAVHEALRTELGTGRPLTMLALRTGRLALSALSALSRTPDPGPVPDRIPARPRPELTLTHIGRLDAYVDLPWTGPAAKHRNISVPTANGPEGITVSFSELSGALYVNVSFHASTFDPAAVSHAVELICHHPVGLVTSPAS
jgi:hypothetical protein